MVAQLKTDLGIAYDVNTTVAVVDLNQDSFYDNPANVPTGDTRAEVTALRDEQFELADASNIITIDTRSFTRSDAWHLTESELERLADVMVTAHLAAFNDEIPIMPALLVNINTNDDISDTGGLADSFGDFTASGGSRPTISNDPADKVLGYRKLDYDGNDSLDNDAYATYLNGDDPAWTMAAIVELTADALSRTIFGAGNEVNDGYDRSGFLGTHTGWTGRKDDAGTTSTVVTTAVATGEPYLVIVRQEGDQRTVFTHKLSDGSEVTNTSTVDRGTLTATKFVLGARFINGVKSHYWYGGMYRWAFANEAFSGDETDYAGTDFGDLVNLMLTPANWNLDSGLNFDLTSDLQRPLDVIPTPNYL